MITNGGKEIISKFMLGQAPSYATHIALGCGARPVAAGVSSYTVTNAQLVSNVATLTTDAPHHFKAGDSVKVSSVGTPFDGIYTIKADPTTTTFTYDRTSASVASASVNGSAQLDFSDKKTMDFEMVRIPISSRGFVNEAGVSKIALAAEMPTEYRYEISEVALWSAGSNSVAANTSDSRVLFTFDTTENWILHNTDTSYTGPIPTQYNALDGGNATGDINVTDPIFATNADNESLLYSLRKDRQEGARFLNYTIIMRGDTSSIDSAFVVSGGSASNSSHIHFDGRNINLARNSPNDEIKFALSLLPKEANNSNLPYVTRVVVEFLQSELSPTVGVARMTHEIFGTDLEVDNKYYVITKALKDIQTSPEFSWNDVRMTRIYVSVFENELDTDPSDQYYVAVDAIRFDNVTSINPLYVMSGYSVVDTSTGRPIVKIANTSNYIEFRLALGVS